MSNDDQNKKNYKKYVGDITAEILTAYFANSQANVKPNEVPLLYQQLYNQILSNYDAEDDDADNASSARSPSGEMATPVVSPEKSIFPDYLVCLECGKHLNMLKRHLKRTHGLSEFEYRDKFNLRSDYPMVCENYSNTRSDIARNSGFGEVRKKKEKKGN